jgi:hypothetical protein
MNYLKHYNLLVNRGKLRADLGGYIENHHIIPACMGGTNELDNLVKLSPEEHYLAHLLLTKIYPDTSGLLYACSLMCSNRYGRRSNKMYGWLRRDINRNIGTSIQNAWARKYGFEDYITQTKCIWDMYTVGNISTSNIQKEIGMSSTNIRNSLHFFAEKNNCVNDLKESDFIHKSNYMTSIRNNFTPEQETRRIKAVRSIDYSARNIKTGSRQGENNPTFGLKWKNEKKECPHCNMSVAGGRWHFDNCRSKNNEHVD